MATKIVDDLTGADIDATDHLKLVVTIGEGSPHEFDTTDEVANAVEALVKATEQDWKIERREVKGSKAAKSGTKATEDRHGLDHKLVRAWAIKNKLKNGVNKDKTITDSSPRLSQHIWDAAFESEDADSLKA
jgi:hypothetical protein